MKIPLLPLNAIICPQGRIPLQIFEPRYLDMISESLKSGLGFVVVLLRGDGANEAVPGSVNNFYTLGTLVEVVDFNESPREGVICVTVEGRVQVRLTDIELQDSGLWLATIKPILNEDYLVLPEKYDELKGR